MSLILGFCCFQELNTNVYYTFFKPKGLKILETRLTPKQDVAKKVRRSLSTTFSINRRNGRMCEFGAVLKEESKCYSVLLQLLLLLGCSSYFWGTRILFLPPLVCLALRARAPQKRLLCRLQISWRLRDNVTYFQCHFENNSFVNNYSMSAQKLVLVVFSLYFLRVTTVVSTHKV